MPNLEIAELLNQNHLLNSLPSVIRNNLLPHLQPVQLVQGDILYHARQPMDYVYFPITAVLSWVATTEDGDRAEVGMVGREGMVGTQILLGQDTLPYHVEVEQPGKALKIGATFLKAEFDFSPAMSHLLLRYIHMGIVQLAQSAVCNRYHTVEARLCRWLLAAHDRIDSNELILTQETLAGMIGARRPAVSIVLGTLQTAGLIQTQRGRIIVVDRRGMEAAACGCYRIIKEELERFLAG